MIQAPDVKPDDRTQTLTRLLKKEIVYEDSHPSLRERVEALGIPANPHASDEVEAILERVSPLEATCWEELVTGSRQQMLDSLMGRILEEIGPAWKHKHEEIQHGIRAFERLKEVDPRQVSAKEAVEYLGAFVAAHSRSEGKKLAIELASIHSGSPEILASAGNYMLEDGDRDGFQFVQKAAELNPEYKYLLHELSAEYHSLVGDSKAARNESLKAQALGEDWQRSFNQLSQLKPEDIQTPMVVSDHLRSDLLKMGAELPDVLEVHAIHNQSAKNEAITAHVILLIARPRGMIHSNDTFAAKQTAKALELLGAHNGLVISTVMDKSKIGKTFVGAPEGCVYRRDS
jgi:hypothetical protein